MRAYLLAAGRVYLAFGSDCVEAAKGLDAKLGLDADPKRWSVGGSWPVEDGTHVDLSTLWPYFTNDPGRHARP